MTKAQLQTLITTNLASGQPITAELHRAVENGLLNEFFNATYIQNAGNENGIQYTARFTKIGNKAIIEATALNTNNFIDFGKLFTFDTSLYFPAFTQVFERFALLNDGVYTNGSPIGINERLYINATYQIND